MKRRLSLTSQLVIVMLLLVAGTIVFCLILNSTFLESYYFNNKKNELLDGYGVINTACQEGTLESEEFDIPFERMCANGNINILVIKGRSTIRSSYSNAQLFQMQLYDMLSEPQQEENRIVERTETYTVEQITDTRMKSEYLVLVGLLSDGSYIYMRTALESIQDSAQITNRFFLMIGLAALLVCLFAIVLLARGISKPILELTELSKRMTRLEFHARYHSYKHGSRELETLGTHMNELADALEKTISELKVANNELQRDIEKKERIDEMRKEFLSNVSHELKTPLAVIQGYAEGLRDGISEDPESRAFYCDVIVDETGKMNQMVKKLLTLNQLEFGNEVVEMERFDLTELVKGLLDASSLMMASKGITAEFLQTQPVYVWGDEFKVEEVISNYLSNAIHHAMYEKKIRITFTEHDGLLRVSVFNTGNPIPEEELEKVWIKFYKVDKARTREYGGSGIGLSIVKAIMDSFHRECGVINHEDGAEFWMELEKSN